MIDIKLVSKPISVPIKYNPYYKLLILLIIINYCTRSPNKASISLIHLVFWAIRDSVNYKVLFDFSKQIRDSLISWTFEPGMNEILSLSFIEEYCDKVIVSGEMEIKITDKGKKVVKEIEELELFTEQINQIKKLGILPKARINKANNNWKLI
tara:strand:+ start:730 stop:1188 length:459 start_codon:yes stop_codon:yes gene_type:complete